MPVAKSAVVRFAGRFQRGGTEAGECEDAVAVLEAPSEGILLRAAVADGASESLFSGQWANAVATVFTEPTPNGLENAVSMASARWKAFADSQDLPWYAEPKRARGAHAALAGIELGVDREWNATAVGDSCLFLVRDNRLALAFPVASTAEFPSLPVLIGTGNAGCFEGGYVRRQAGTWRDGDDFYLMTDALAVWFLTESEAGKEPWRWLSDIGERNEPERAFRERITTLRADGRLRNDDVALIHLHLPGELSAEAVTP